jgi:hypothetical protein
MEQGYSRDALEVLKHSLTNKKNTKGKEDSFLEIITPYATTKRKGPKIKLGKLNLGTQENQLLGTFTIRLIETLQVEWEKLSTQEKTDERFLNLAQPVLLWLHSTFSFCVEQDNMEKFKGGAYVGELMYATALSCFKTGNSEISQLQSARKGKNEKKRAKEPPLTKRKELFPQLQNAVNQFITADLNTRNTLKELYTALMINTDENFRTPLIHALTLYAKLNGQSVPNEDTLSEFAKAIEACSSEHAAKLKQLRPVETKLPTLSEIKNRLIHFTTALEPYTSVAKEEIKQKNLGLAQSLMIRANKQEMSETEIVYNLRAWGLILVAFLDESNQGNFKFRPPFLSGVAGALGCLPKANRTDMMKSLKEKIDAILIQNKITPEFQAVLQPLAVALIKKKTAKETRAILLEAFNYILEALHTNNVTDELREFARVHAAILAPFKLFQLNAECKAMGELFPQSVISLHGKKKTQTTGMATHMSKVGQFKGASRKSLSDDAETTAMLVTARLDKAAQQKAEDKHYVDSTLDGLLDDLNDIVVTNPTAANKSEDSDDQVESENNSSETIPHAKPSAVAQKTVVAEISAESEENSGELEEDSGSDEMDPIAAALLNPTAYSNEEIKDLIALAQTRVEAAKKLTADQSPNSTVRVLRK